MIAAGASSGPVQTVRVMSVVPSVYCACAGASGAPAGISIHWSTCALYTAGGGETLLLPFTKRVAPTIDFDAGRIVIEPPREVEDEG